MTLDDVSEIIAGLADVRQTSVLGRRRWQLGGRLIAREIDEHTVVIRSAFDHREHLLSAHPRLFSVSPRFEGHQMVLADLRQDADGAVVAALTAAYQLQQR